MLSQQRLDNEWVPIQNVGERTARRWSAVGNLCSTNTWNGFDTTQGKEFDIKLNVTYRLKQKQKQNMTWAIFTMSKSHNHVWVIAIIATVHTQIYIYIKRRSLCMYKHTIKLEYPFLRMYHIVCSAHVYNNLLFHFCPHGYTRVLAIVIMSYPGYSWVLVAIQG